MKPPVEMNGKSNGRLPWNTARTIYFVFLKVRELNTVAGHSRDQTSSAVKIQGTRFLDERNALSSSSHSSWSTCPDVFALLNSRANRAARSNNLATVFHDNPSILAIADLLTPSTLSATTRSNATIGC